MFARTICTRYQSFLVVGALVLGGPVLGGPVLDGTGPNQATPQSGVPVAAKGELTLGVGKPAPALRVGTWLRGEAIAAFEPGTTYVVEFWATWCGPCLRVIPHLQELQAHYDASGQKVRFVGVSIWEDDPALVAPFVAAQGDEMTYAVATDLVAEGEEGACAAEWMDAAGQAQIPTAFVVDGRRRIAWIGHPAELDQPLAKIVAGEWDLAAATLDHQRRMAVVVARMRLGQELAELSRAGKWDEAVRRVEASLADHPNLELELGLHKYNLLARGADPAAAQAYGRRLVAVVFRDEPGKLGALAWSIVDPRAESAERDLALARRAAERANELTEWSEASLIDTLALIVFEQGETQKAIQLQEKAVRLAAGTAFEQELTQRLARFRQESEAD